MKRYSQFKQRIHARLHTHCLQDGQQFFLSSEWGTFFVRNDEGDLSLTQVSKPPQYKANWSIISKPDVPHKHTLPDYSNDLDSRDKHGTIAQCLGCRNVFRYNGLVPWEEHWSRLGFIRRLFYGVEHIK